MKKDLILVLRKILRFILLQYQITNHFVVEGGVYCRKFLWSLDFAELLIGVGLLEKAKKMVLIN